MGIQNHFFNQTHVERVLVWEFGLRATGSSAKLKLGQWREKEKEVSSTMVQPTDVVHCTVFG
jgi:hypothetical protein